MAADTPQAYPRGAASKRPPCVVPWSDRGERCIVSDGLRLAAALAALFCAAGCMRLAVALARVTRGRRTVAGAALLVLSGSIAGAAFATAGRAAAARARAHGDRARRRDRRRASPPRSPCPSPARSSAGARASLAPGRSLDRASRVAAAGADRCEPRRGALADRRRGARAALGARRARCCPIEGGDRAGIEAALAEHGAEGVAVGRRARSSATRARRSRRSAPRSPTRTRASCWTASRPSAAAPSPASRRARARPRRAGSTRSWAASPASSPRCTTAAPWPPRWRPSCAAACRSRASACAWARSRSAGTRRPAAPEDDRPRAEEVLVFDGFALGTVAYAPTRPLTLDEELLADRVIDAGALALGVAGLRSAGPPARGGAGGARARGRVAGRRAAARPRAAAAGRRSCRARCTRTPPRSGWTSPSRSACASTHVHGHPITLLGATVSSAHRRGRRGHQRRPPGRRAARGRRPRRAPRAGRRAPRAGGAAAPGRSRARRARRLLLRRPPRLLRRRRRARPGARAARLARGRDRAGLRRARRAGAHRPRLLGAHRGARDGAQQRRAARVAGRVSRVRRWAPTRRACASPPSSRTASRARARRRSGSSCWPCASVAWSPPGGLGSDSPRVGRGAPPGSGRRAAGRADRARGRAHRRRRRDAAVAAHARVRRRRRARSPSACASPRPPPSSACSSRRPSGARARRRASCSASARCSRPTSTRARCCGRSWRRPSACWAPTPAPCACSRRTSSSCARPRARRSRASAASGSRSATCWRPRCSRPPGPWRSTTSPPTAGWRRTIRCSRPASRAGPARRSRAPTAACRACWRSSAASPRRLRDDEVEALAAFANSASVALRNALLYEAVASEKDRVAAILGRVADAIVATDAEGRILLWNAAAEQITQIPERRALGRVLAELLSSELGDADGSAHGMLARRGRDRDRGAARARPARSCGSRSRPRT